MGPAGWTLIATVSWDGAVERTVASFDRRSAKALERTDRDRQHCVEGWSLYAFRVRIIKAPSTQPALMRPIIILGPFDLLGLERTSRLRPATCRKDSRRDRWQFRHPPYPTRWVSTRREWTAGSTTPMLDGREGHLDDIRNPSPFHVEGFKGTTINY